MTVIRPDDLRVGPQYGLAIGTSLKPGAVMPALTILSAEGRAMPVKQGFKAVGLPVR